MNSYFDISKTNDKIIHLLYAGFICNNYNDSRAACVREFGKESTKIAEKEFNKIKSAFYKETKKK